MNFFFDFIFCQNFQSNKTKRDELKKKYATTAIVMTSGSDQPSINNIDLVRAKSATLTRNQTSFKASSSSSKKTNKRSQQSLDNKSLEKVSLKLPTTTRSRSLHLRHQQSYKRSLALSLFEHKWHVLQDRYPQPRSSTGLVYQSDISKSSSTNDNLRQLVNVFWTAICLLESDFEHEFLLAVEIISQILNKIDLNTGTANNGQLLVHKNEFRTNLELFAFRINWPGYPGLQNLLLKGCTCPSPNAVEATQKLLVQLIPHCSKLNFIEPSGSEELTTHGLNGVALNLLALLPTLILNYEKPNDLCIKAAQEYFKVNILFSHCFCYHKLVKLNS